MILFILFHPYTRYSPDTNQRLLPKPAGSFYRFGCQGRDPVVRSKCSIVILAGSILIPCLLASQLWQTYSIVKQCSQNNNSSCICICLSCFLVTFIWILP